MKIIMSQLRAFLAHTISMCLMLVIPATLSMIMFSLTTTLMVVGVLAVLGIIAFFVSERQGK